jgi:hypothetical protein
MLLALTKCTVDASPQLQPMRLGTARLPPCATQRDLKLTFILAALMSPESWLLSSSVALSSSPTL